MAAKSNRIKIQNVIGMYAQFLFKAREPQKAGGGKAKYGLCCAIPKERSSEWDELRSIAMSALRAKFGTGKDGSVLTDDQLTGLVKAGKLKWPIHDGDIDQPGDKSFAGMIYFNASSIDQPGIVDSKVKKVTSQDECYSGCSFNVTISVYPFDQDGGRGVALGLGNVQVTKKGKRLDNRKSAEEDFDEVPDEGGSSAPSQAGSVQGLI